jgi:RNA polymerase sigma-54 factor
MSFMKRGKDGQGAHLRNLKRQAVMKITFGQNLSLKQTQTLAPRMIQSMEVLQLAQAELEAKIERELIENPVLERSAEEEAGEETSASQNEEAPGKDVEQKELIIEESSGGEDDFERLLNLDKELPDFFDTSRPSSNRIEEDSDRQHDLMSNVVNRDETLQDYLISQLHEMDLDEKLLAMCERIISSLSATDGGRLNMSLRDLLPADATEDDLELAENALAHVQQLDPPGVAARDLGECLLLQLRSDIPHLKNVRTLILHHLDDLSHNRLPHIQKATGMTIEQIHEAWEELRQLDPKPGSKFAESFVPSVTPDLWLEINDEGNYVVKMDETPARGLTISNYYRQRLANGQVTPEEREFIKRKITAAQWLIESIEQRRNTLTRVAQAIVNYQRDFFDNGPEFLKPLKMEQIADVVGVHVTTVSRAVDEKWIETHRGIFPLRMFFVHGTTTQDGEDIAWSKIRLELQKLVEHEDKSKPFSDDEIKNRLKSLGFNVARRTVTKYREKMEIPSSRERRDWTLKKTTDAQVPRADGVSHES